MRRRTVSALYCNRPTPKRGARVLLLVLSLVGATCQANDDSISKPTAFPPSLLGTWQVAEVHVDQDDTRPFVYKYNIHKFLGRVFVFTPQQLTHNTVPRDSSDKRRCESPEIIVHHTTAGYAVGMSLASRPFYPIRPRPKDFQLPLAESAPVEALSMLCKDGLFYKTMGGCLEPDCGINGAWLIVLNPKQLALRWHDEVFLILQRIPENAKPVASFDCAKAATVVEKTICGSVALASYDQSVAYTYKHALGYYQFALKTYNPGMRKQTTAQIVAFKKSQKGLLTKRDACGSDATCLDNAMGERIWDMDREIAFYAYDNRDIR